MSYLKLFFLLLLLSAKALPAQDKLKVRREDNRFLFFQTGTPKDTLVKAKSDLFVIHFPDSLQHHLAIYLRNGQLVKTNSDSLFRLIYIPGMTYSLSRPDTAYLPLLEGICDPSRNIGIDIKNIRTGTMILHNNIIVK